ncbi:C-5 cytosine-specific DNA methylase (plasmid) [Cylindrospermum sp. NIES-4074]|nr:C-5 cytosine-specific DNA methylase [Cylindrospermum sp. NIES-4074]
MGEIIEDSPNEYFVVRYGKNDLKCYFWGQDDKLISQLAIASRAPEAIAPQNLIDQFLRETSDTPTISPKKKKVASGSLAPYIENKKLKSGLIVSYPRVNGERDKLNHLHWKWGYYYEIKVNGEWKNRSLPVPAKIIPQVKIMIENCCCVDEIKDFILQSKNKSADSIGEEG